jgi:hypothetical protein
MSDRQESAKATVHYDSTGRIIAVVLAPEGPNVPPAGILPMPGSKSAEIEIPRELVGMSVLEIHEACQVDAKSGTPRLVRARKGGDKQNKGRPRSPSRRAKQP